MFSLVFVGALRGCLLVLQMGEAFQAFAGFANEMPLKMAQHMYMTNTLSSCSSKSRTCGKPKKPTTQSSGSLQPIPEAGLGGRVQSEWLASLIETSRKFF